MYDPQATLEYMLIQVLLSLHELDKIRCDMCGVQLDHAVHHSTTINSRPGTIVLQVLLLIVGVVDIMMPVVGPYAEGDLRIKNDARVCL